MSIQLNFEDSYDETVSQILSQKDSPHFEAPEGYEELYEMLVSTSNEPMLQFKSFGEYRFRVVKEMVETQLFNLDYLAAYAVELALLEDLHRLDKEEGEKILNTIVKDTA